MFKSLKNKVKTELDKEQSSTNVSLCSSMSSSRIDLTQEDQNEQKSQALDSFAALVNHNEEEDDNDEIVQKLSPEFKKKSIKDNLDFLINKNETKEKTEGNIFNSLLTKIENFSDIKLSDKKISLLINNNDEKTSQITNQNESINLKEIEELKKKVKTLEQELKQSNDLNKKLEANNTSLRNSKMETNLRNNKLFNKLDELKNNSNKAQSEVNKLQKENRLLINQIEDYNQKIENLKENLRIEKEEKIVLKNELNKMKMNTQIKNENTNDKLINELNEKINNLEDQILDKNKVIKLQNQRIHDIKKSLQKGDLLFKEENKQINSNGNLETDYPSTNGSSSKLDEAIINLNTNTKNQDELGKLNNNKDYATYVNDINFKYLQNVILKFITANDIESQKHLVKAISTLLKFTDEQEKFIKQSIDSKNSWFKLPDNLKF